MAASRRQTEILAALVRDQLNRPDEDDLFPWPNRFYEALSQAHRRIYGKIAQHAPQLLASTITVTSSDSGASYDLADHHYGDLQVWTPPGPPTGLRIYPALAESPYIGFYVSGTKIYLTRSQTYSPGLYVVGVWATVADLSESQQHVLPAYCEDMMIYEAAYALAKTPGFLGDADHYRQMALREWKGDGDDGSDMGILGTIKRLAANEGIESSSGFDDIPWYHHISSQ